MIFEVKNDSELTELRDVLEEFYKILPYKKKFKWF